MFNIQSFLESFSGKEKYLIYALVLLMTLVVVYRWHFFPLSFTGDARGFLSVADHLLGFEIDVKETRYLKPLGPGVVAAFMYFGVSAKTALLLQSVLMYYALGLATYWFGRLLFRSSLAGFLTAVLIVISYPIVRYGLNYFMETGAWAFYFLSLAGIILWYRKPKFKYVVLISIALLCGLLWKEYAVLAGLVFALAILFQPLLRWQTKIHTLLQTAFLVILPWSMWQLYVWVHFSYSYIDWMLIGSTGYERMYSIIPVGKSLFMLLTVVWPFTFLGIWFWSRLKLDEKRLLQFLSLPSFGFLLWGFVSSRLFFSLVPLIAPLAVHGILQLKNKLLMLGLVVFLLMSNALLLWISFIPTVRTFLNQITYG